VIVVAVPVKDLVNAKRRLMPVLTPEERTALARAMLRDVLRALRGAALDAVWVVTRDTEVRALAQASRSVGSPQIRNRGTLGGNLGTASPAGDTLPVLAVHDAEVLLAAAGGRARVLRWNEFQTGVKRTAIAPDELIIGARWRVLLGPQSFSKVGTRSAMVISVASLCLALDPVERQVRVALGSVAPTVIRAPDAEALAAEALARAGAWDEPAAPPPDGTAEAFAERVAAAATPIDDVRGTARYRRRAVEVLARRALSWAIDERADEALVS